LSEQQAENVDSAEALAEATIGTLKSLLPSKKTKTALFIIARLLLFCKIC
jgi:hypothetical protein